MKRALLMLLVLAACAGDPERPPPEAERPAGPVAGGSTTGNDGGTTRDSGRTGDAGSCNDLVNAGAVVAQNASADALPAGQGGTEPQGTFELVEATIYQSLGTVVGPTGKSYQTTIRIQGQIFERVERTQTASGSAFEVRSGGTISLSSPNATVGLSCPQSAQEQLSYTSSGDSLTVTNLLTNESFVFAKKL